MNAIYLDHNATTPVSIEVVEAMLPYFTQHYGNAASKTHAFGWIAEQAVSDAQLKVAQLIHAEKDEIIFTSGATESINMAIKGLAATYGSNKNHIVSCVTEHAAVLDTLHVLSRQGFTVTLLEVDRLGAVDLEALERSITKNTLMVCMMHANNETGTIHPIAAIAAICKAHDTLFFCDATQSAGKLTIDVKEDPIDLLCLSAHKMYGPKGIGALYIKTKRPKLNVQALIDGGGHQRGLRAGTLNVPGIVGFGKAAAIAQEQLWEDGVKISKLRTILEQQLTLLPDVFINGDIKNRLFNTSNLCFKQHQAADLIKGLKNIAVSNGSACASAIASASHVLLAMGLSKEEAQSSIRFSFGRTNTMEEVNQVISTISKLYQA